MGTRILKVHDQFDRFASEWLAHYQASGRALHCRRGCAGCCHMAVHATWPEALTAAGALAEQQVSRLDAYVVRLQAVLPELADLRSYLKRHRQELGPCPFLDAEESCSIYPCRPLSCRALLSTRPAAWCTVDFTALSQWDKQAYESSLDRQVVAWPTHYVAATQDFGRELENTLLETMQREQGWALSGNFAVMVWLAWRSRQLGREIGTLGELNGLLEATRLDSRLLLTINGDGPGQSPRQATRAE